MILSLVGIFHLLIRYYQFYHYTIKLYITKKAYILLAQLPECLWLYVEPDSMAIGMGFFALPSFWHRGYTHYTL